MRIHQLEIRNFRGIALLDWHPTIGLTSLVGPGDAGKTTILDAIGLLFSPRWNHSFSDNDFHGGHSTGEPIVIRATVVEPPVDLMRLEAFAGYVRGVHAMTGKIVDEPDDELPALTLELRVEHYMEPIWQVIADRHQVPAPIRARQRAAFGIVRIGSDSLTDLRWARNSALLRLTGADEHKPTGEALVDASRAAKQATSASFSELDTVAKQVTDRARQLRAIPSTTTLHAALNSDLFQVSEGAVSLHAGAVPMERHGLGSRRLTGISVQLADSADAQILLVDEIESGLEPFRIRHLLRALETRLGPSNLLSQVFVTTHSPVVLRELTYKQLGVVRRKNNVTEVLTPGENMQRMLRANAEAFLAPKVLICEGATEVGFAREIYANAELRDPQLVSSVATADANGESNLIEYMAAFIDLGYLVAVFCDYDTDIDLASAQSAEALIRSDKGNCTEQQVLHSLSRLGLAAAIQHGINALGEISVFATLSNHGCSEEVARNVLLGSATTADSVFQVQTALGLESSKGKNQSSWFKTVTGGEQLAMIAAHDPDFEKRSPAARIISELENWATQ